MEPRPEPCFILKGGIAVQYTCSVCGEKIDGGPSVFINHTETHIINSIKKDHPDWVEENGVCSKCENFYRQQLKGGN